MQRVRLEVKHDPLIPRRILSRLIPHEKHEVGLERLRNAEGLGEAGVVTLWPLSTSRNLEKETFEPRRTHDELRVGRTRFCENDITETSFDQSLESSSDPRAKPNRDRGVHVDGTIEHIEDAQCVIEVPYNERRKGGHSVMVPHLALQCLTRSTLALRSRKGQDRRVDPTLPLLNGASDARIDGNGSRAVKANSLSMILTILSLTIGAATLTLTACEDETSNPRAAHDGAPDGDATPTPVESCEEFTKRLEKNLANTRLARRTQIPDGAATTKNGHPYEEAQRLVTLDEIETVAARVIAKIDSGQADAGPRSKSSALVVFTSKQTSMGELAAKLSSLAEAGVELRLGVATTELPPLPDDIPQWAREAIAEYRREPQRGHRALSEGGMRRALLGCSTELGSAYDVLASDVSAALDTDERLSVSRQTLIEQLRACDCAVTDRRAIEVLAMQWLAADWQVARWVPLPLPGSHRDGAFLEVEEEDNLQSYVSKLEHFDAEQLRRFRIKLSSEAPDGTQEEASPAE